MQKGTPCKPAGDRQGLPAPCHPREPVVRALQQFAGVVAHLLQAGDGVAGLGAQANRPAVALAPFGGDQLIQHLWCVAGPLFQHGADRLGHQVQAGQLPCGGQDVGGVGALRDAPR